MAARAVKRLAGNGQGQSLVDRMTSMKHSIAGSLIAKTICKATTEEMNAPKRKHLNILVNCTYEPRLSMPEFANYIIGRSHNSSWVVSFKALITIHHLMNYGSERFSQYLASNNCQLSTPRSFEKNSSQAATMYLFIRHYARYLDARCSSYREVAFDFCKIKQKNDEVNMKTMPQAKLFKVLPPLERQIDALLAFDASSNELFNGVVLAAFVNLYKDLIRLYAVYNEGMINIIEKFFSMSKKDCQEALQIYKSFLKRMEGVNHFIKISEACDSLQLHDGFGKQSLIFKPVPPSVLEALESHLMHMENKKLNETKTSPTKSSTAAVASVSGKASTAAAAPAVTGDLVQLSDSSAFSNLSPEQQRIIEEERQRLEAFVSQAHAKCAANANGGGSNSLDERSSSDGDLLQLFGPLDSKTTTITQGTGTGASSSSTNFFLEDWLEPSLPASSSFGALAQPRPISHFLTDSHAAVNPNNPFLTPNAWPTTTTTTMTTTTPAVEAKPADDLDSRLAEIAGQLTVSKSTIPTTTTAAAAAGTGKQATNNPWMTAASGTASAMATKMYYPMARPPMQPMQQQLAYPTSAPAHSQFPLVQYPQTTATSAFAPRFSNPLFASQSVAQAPAYNPLNPFL